jgi:hypothetical protein
MKYYKASTKHLCGVWLIILCISFAPFLAQGQSWKWSLGPTLTNYQFRNSKGNAVHGMKPSAGLHVELNQERVVLDTVRLISKFSNNAIYFSNHPGLMKALSYLHYCIGLNYDQLNAIGDIQQISFSYQTDFLGFSAEFGPRIPVYKGWNLGVSGVLTGMQLISGHQMLASRYYSLQADRQFNTSKVFGGFQVEISKEVSPTVRAFTNIRLTSTLFSPQTPTGKLDLQPLSISMGISLSR